MKKIALLLAVVLCLSLAGCKEEKQERIAPTRSTDPILNIHGGGTTDAEIHTSVYVTVFGNTAYLASYPKETDGDEKEPACAIREISKGGTIICGGGHEDEVPITHVVILDKIYPDSTADWFRNMTSLRSIDGLGNLSIEHVTNMSNMFNGCTRLVELEIGGWDVSGVEDMTGMFDGCDALSNRPSWYQE